MDIKEENKCGCRYQIGDYGWFECSLIKNHTGNHTFQDTDTKDRYYSVEWSQHPTRDIIIDLDWMTSNTNLEEALTIVNEKYDFLDGYTIYTDHNGPNYGTDFNINVDFYFTDEVRKGFYRDSKGRFADIEPYDKYCEFESQLGFYLEGRLMDELNQNLNIDISEYSLAISIRMAY